MHRLAEQSVRLRAGIEKRRHRTIAEPVIKAQFSQALWFRSGPVASHNTPTIRFIYKGLGVILWGLASKRSHGLENNCHVAGNNGVILSLLFRHKRQGE